MFRKKSIPEIIEDEESNPEDENNQIIEKTDKQKIELTEEQEEIENFLKRHENEKNEEKENYLDHDEFNFHAVFRKSIKEPKARLIY